MNSRFKIYSLLIKKLISYCIENVDIDSSICVWVGFFLFLKNAKEAFLRGLKF